MNTKIPNNNSSDEVDLGQIFNAIGRLFDKFFKFIGSIFIAIFSFIIYFLKAVIDHLMIIIIVVGSAFMLGFIIDKNRPPIYEASMLVKPYFDSKYQLINDVNYYNSLLNEKNFDVLSKKFNISQKEAEKLLSFEVETGPETKNELLKEYDFYLSSIDSSRAENITYNEFVENRDIYSSELFLVIVKSLKNDIFRKLENGIDSTFSNRYSAEQKRIRDKTLDIRKSTYQTDLERMDTLQNVYLDVVKNESEKGAAFVNVQGLLPLQQEKTKTWEYELFQSEMRIRDSIRALEQIKIEEDVYYDVLSRFPEIGNESSKITSKYWFIFSLSAFVLLCILFLTIRAFKFIKNYEG